MPLCWSSKESSPVNLPYLPDELLLNCLARVSRSYYPTLSVVSKRFRSLLASMELYKTRTLIGSTEGCPYVCLQFIDTCEPRWFTLSKGPTRIPRWSFTSCLNPCRNLRNRMSMISVPSNDLVIPSMCKSATIGSTTYVIGGYIFYHPSCRVFVMDCRSHTCHEAPSMHVARNSPLVSVVDGKIYVVEGRPDRNYSNFMEFFDPKTQVWENAPSPSAEIRGEVLYVSFAYEGNLYLLGNKNMVYKPKENKWYAGGLWDGISGVTYNSCLVDGVIYSCPERLKWYDPEGISWRDLKGLKELPKIPKDSPIRLVNYGGNIVAFWVGNVGSSKKWMLWGAEIEIERRNGKEIFGKIKWCDVVLTVPKLFFIWHLIVATV